MHPGPFWLSRATRRERDRRQRSLYLLSLSFFHVSAQPRAGQQNDIGREREQQAKREYRDTFEIFWKTRLWRRRRGERTTKVLQLRPGWTWNIADSDHRRDRCRFRRPPPGRASSWRFYSPGRGRGARLGERETAKFQRRHRRPDRRTANRRKKFIERCVKITKVTGVRRSRFAFFY